MDWPDFEQCTERFYGLVSGSDELEEEDESVDDIEASIQREVASIDNKKGSTKLFSPVHLDLECVLFFKTSSPIDPVDFVHRICKEVVSKPDVRRMRYVNRLTPMTIIGKATEKGLEEVGKTVLGTHFQLSDGGKEGEEDDPKYAPYSVSAASSGQYEIGLQPRRYGYRFSLSCGHTFFILEITSERGRLTLNSMPFALRSAATPPSSEIPSSNRWHQWLVTCIK